MCLELGLNSQAQFLMHRVELKDPYSSLEEFREKLVPNAPCGVERKRRRKG
jgi:hypothetical protein